MTGPTTRLLPPIRRAVPSPQNFYEAAGIVTGQCPFPPKPKGYEALQTGDFKEYEKLKQQGCTFDWTDTYGNRAMHIAAKGGNVQILQDLADSGHAVNAVNNDGETPILCAVTLLEIDAVLFLEGLGADLDVQPKIGLAFHKRMQANGMVLQRRR